MKVITWLILGPCLLGSCITRTTSKPDFGHAEARQADPVGAWRVLEGGQVRGYVVRFVEERGSQVVLTSVRNVHNQDMGWIDDEGRAWRYRLHGDPDWVGTGSVLQGTRWILGLDVGAELEPTDIKDLSQGH